MFVYIYAHTGLVQESYVLYTMKDLDSKPEHHKFGKYPATSNPCEALKAAVQYRKQGYSIRPGYQQEYAYIQRRAVAKLQGQ